MHTTLLCPTMFVVILLLDFTREFSVEFESLCDPEILKSARPQSKNHREAP